MTLLTIESLHVAYGRTQAVRGIDLMVPQGATVCVIGANGAGKTTMMRATTGLKRASSGRILFDSQDITAWSPHRIAAAGLRLVPEGRGIFAELTVAENLRLGAWRGTDVATRAHRQSKILEKFPRLAERLDQQAGSMSGGEQQMLALGRALMSAPRLLLLDEPSMGLAPLVVEDIFSTIAELKREGTTILLVEQNASAALDVADEAYVLETGRIVLSGSARDVAEDPAVAAHYLGG
jgi:branched-chain amino acid transport system ATP-binding protein